MMPIVIVLRCFVFCCIFACTGYSNDYQTPNKTFILFNFLSYFMRWTFRQLKERWKKAAFDARKPSKFDENCSSFETVADAWKYCQLNRKIHELINLFFLINLFLVRTKCFFADWHSSNTQQESKIRHLSSVTIIFKCGKCNERRICRYIRKVISVFPAFRFAMLKNLTVSLFNSEFDVTAQVN